MCVVSGPLLTAADSHFRSEMTAQAARGRAELLRQVRGFFDARDFIEVQPPVLSSEFVIDRHIDPIVVDIPIASSHEGNRWYLQSSPEAAMKRLMAGGELPQIYSLGPVFRAGEAGSRHNPEFTMLEWYRVGDDLKSVCGLIDDLLATALDASPAARVRYTEAFLEHVGVDPLTADVRTLIEASKRLGVAVDASFSEDRDDWLNLLAAEVVQEQLGRDCPTILTHFPASQAALARLDAQDSRVAERFEVFVEGMELANGYVELLDADELQRRCIEENRLRELDGKTALPQPLKLLAAMRAGLPPMSGCALGFDRLVMLKLGLASIERAICFTVARA